MSVTRKELLFVTYIKNGIRYVKLVYIINYKLKNFKFSININQYIDSQVLTKFH